LQLFLALPISLLQVVMLLVPLALLSSPVVRGRACGRTSGSVCGHAHGVGGRGGSGNRCCGADAAPDPDEVP